MRDLKDKHILVLGGKSMIGRSVIQALKNRGHYSYIVPRYHNAETNDIVDYISKNGWDYVINCIGYNGGIEFNKKYPADIYGKTVRMNMNILYASLIGNVKAVISPIPSCSYAALNPDGSPRQLLSEENFLAGPPHPSVECHGAAKRVIFDYSKQLYKQYGFESLSVVLNNCYGPYDRFDPERGKVVSGLITKFVKAKQERVGEVECFGDGSPRREFLFAEDAGEGIVRALESYDDPMSVLNIGSGSDVTIKYLAETIAKIVGYDGRIVWNTDYSNGQMKKLLDNQKMLSLLKWRPNIRLEDGLRRTIQWYTSEIQNQ